LGFAHFSKTSTQELRSAVYHVMIGFAALSLMAETTAILIKSLYGRNLRARYPTFPVATALEQPPCINGAQYTIIYNPANAHTHGHINPLIRRGV
jgi:hypothetical protein